jgi:hypothetical protein
MVRIYTIFVKVLRGSSKVSIIDVSVSQELHIECNKRKSPIQSQKAINKDTKFDHIETDY